MAQNHGNGYSVNQEKFYVSILLYSSLNFFSLGQENNIAYFNALKPSLNYHDCLSRKIHISAIEPFVLGTMTIIYNTMKSQYLQRALCNCSSQILYYYLSFKAPDFVQMALDVIQFMDKINFVKFKFRGYWEMNKSKSSLGHIGSLVLFIKIDIMFI